MPMKKGWDGANGEMMMASDDVGGDCIFWNLFGFD